MASDNTLLVVAVIAVLVSAVGMFVVMGIDKDVRFAPENVSTAVTNVTIQSNVAINFSQNFIDWGTGFVPAGLDSVNLSTFDGSNGTYWNNVSDGFHLENIGSVNVTLSLKTQKNATAFLGVGDGNPLNGPRYQYLVSNVEAGSCDFGGDISEGVFYDVNDTIVSSEVGTNVCGVYPNGGPGLSFESARNEIRVDILLQIPRVGSTQAALTDTMTATAEPVV